jgi:UV DNA damage endonuclease
MSRPGIVRLGLCCLFLREPISFRTTTAKYVLSLNDESRRRARLAELCRLNALALKEAIRYCAVTGIGAFRVNSRILPLKTHPRLGYEIDALPDGALLKALFVDCGRVARKLNVRLSFHPDQFIVPTSPRDEVARASLAELEYHGEVAQWIGADVINLHAGGAYGDKQATLWRWPEALERLSQRVRSRLTLENDDRIFSPSELLPLCEKTGIPFVYDAHHHRCLPDGVSEAETTARAVATWNREPLFHLSSPATGWSGKNPSPHDDMIDVRDFPNAWRPLTLTVDVEAKAKEQAVKRLAADLAGLNVRLWTPPANKVTKRRLT